MTPKKRWRLVTLLKERKAELEAEYESEDWTNSRTPSVGYGISQQIRACQQLIDDLETSYQ